MYCIWYTFTTGVKKVQICTCLHSSYMSKGWWLASWILCKQEWSMWSGIYLNIGIFQSWLWVRVALNPLNAELNPICKSQLAELFCGVFKFCVCFSKNLNILRFKQNKFVKQEAFCGEGNRHWSECLKNAVRSLLLNGEGKFINKLVNIHVLLLALWSRLQLFALKMDEKMSHKLFFVW